MKKKRERVRRYGFIINYPFLATASQEIVVLDINNLTPEQQELYEKQNRDFSAFKTPDKEKYFDFAVCEYFQKEDKEIIGKIVSERMFFKSNELAQEYFKTVDFIDYLCYQVEIGEECGTQHFQGFMRFKQPMDFDTVHATFPMMSVKRCDGSNIENRLYCKKDETRDPNYEFYEQGEFKEERQRSDAYLFRDDFLAGDDIPTLFEKHPNYVVAHYKGIKEL
jgi:hypothetical protein